MRLKLTTYSPGIIRAPMFVLKYKLGSLGRTERKPRTKSEDMYGSSIFSDNASFWAPDSPAKKKLDKRIAQGLCRGCGNEYSKCRCKRKSK